MDEVSGGLRFHFALPPGKTNVVVDALSWKSRGVLTSVASREWQILDIVGQFGL